MRKTAYDRGAAVVYAHKWAYGRNPKYYNFDSIGGDCTNFISQCIFAGSGIMNYTSDFGWYYISANNKAPAWTGVPYLYNFLTMSANSAGPVAEKCSKNELQKGDIIQLGFSENTFGHSLIVVESNGADILCAAHTDDSDYRSLSSYYYERIRFLHIEYVLSY